MCSSRVGLAGGGAAAHTPDRQRRPMSCLTSVREVKGAAAVGRAAAVGVASSALVRVAAGQAAGSS